MYYDVDDERRWDKMNKESLLRWEKEQAVKKRKKLDLARSIKEAAKELARKDLGGERKSHGGYLESIKEKNLTEMATRAYEIAGKEDHQRRWWFERHGSGMTKFGRDRRFS